MFAKRLLAHAHHRWASKKLFGEHFGVNLPHIYHSTYTNTRKSLVLKNSSIVDERVVPGHFMKEWVKSVYMSFLQTLVDLPRILFFHFQEWFV